jgi:hypothetical protein
VVGKLELTFTQTLADAVHEQAFRALHHNGIAADAGQRVDCFQSLQLIHGPIGPFACLRQTVDMGKRGPNKLR